jgi:hypothetical protein
MPTTNSEQLGLFLDALNNQTPPVPTPDQRASTLIGFFSGDVPSGNPPPAPAFSSPGAGITDHGPQFWGRVDVTSLFFALFTTFPDMQWTRFSPSGPGVPAPELAAGNEIGIQVTATGGFQKAWFQHSHASKPLSQLGDGQRGRLGKARGDTSGLPAFIVCTFDGSAAGKIKQMAIYMDRYAMMQSITRNPGDWGPDKGAFVTLGTERHRVEVGGERGRRITITIED